MPPPINLPDHLRERCRPLNDLAPAVDGEFVLYWCHHAARDHHNPALDTALHAAEALRLPVLVYQGLGGPHRFNSDRHHTFILAGARSLRRILHQRSIPHVFWLGRDPAEPTPLTGLARRAALVVAEDYPAPPFPAWSERLARQVDVPVWALDSCCIVPMQSLEKRYDRAFRFRERTADEFRQRLLTDWPAPPRVEGFHGDPGFTDTDLDTPIAELVAGCAIDHAVGPVPHTPGGMEAGYVRWEHFKREGLRHYANRRNDAADATGVSRMSPYLHHGMVSPFRLAREAQEMGGKGAEKFLDEMLTWREMAHNFCFHTPDPESLSAIPDWARNTLKQHQSDSRPALYSWEQLARGQTGDALWDAAQRSLLSHGELHNNVRMTWAKAVLQWTGSPERALEMLIDLNHRYALDGNDPNSYGGLLWALGAFDRPFTPAKPITGTVRPRDTRSHARRLDMPRYRALTQRPALDPAPRVAVVGAGLSGLMAARSLADHGLEVTVFDKARGVSGRAATRRHGERVFDHGAQYFTARDPRFQHYVCTWREQGLVAPWQGTIATARDSEISVKTDNPKRYVGIPGMSALGKHLAEPLTVVLQTRIHELSRDNGSWRLHAGDSDEFGPFQVVLLALPAEQAVPLLSASPALRAQAAGVRMQPTWTVLAGFEAPLAIPADGLFCHDSSLSWIARSNSKPGRNGGENWVLHASADWSEAHLEDEPEAVIQAQLAELYRVTGCAPGNPVLTQAHRWRYAQAGESLNVGCLWDGDLGLGVCGDWCQGSRVEGAFLSGMAMAGRVLGTGQPVATRERAAPATP